MIGYLQSQDRFKDRLKIGPDEKLLTIISESDSKTLPLVGHYSLIAGRRTVLYRWDGNLRLQFGELGPIDLKNSEAHWNYQGDQVTFTLHQAGTELINETYRLNPDIKAIDSDPTPMVEAEHFDFFLFVRNVLSEPSRADRIYRDGQTF